MRFSIIAIVCLSCCKPNDGFLLIPFSDPPVATDSASGDSTPADTSPGDSGLASCTGSLDTVNANHSATLLPDGTVLIAGGSSSVAIVPITYKNLSLIYNPASNQWFRTAPLNFTRAGHSSVLLNDGRVLVAGGNDANAPLATTEVYLPTTHTWQLSGTMTTPRTIFGLIKLNSGAALAIGGWTGTSVTATVDYFDPVTETWSPRTPMSIPRSDFAAALLPDGRVLVVGGNPTGVSGGNTNTVELYDEISDSWSVGPSISVATAAVEAVVVTPNIVATTAFDGSAFRALTYDVALNQWNETLNFGHAFNSAAALTQGGALFCGGDRASATLSTCEFFDANLETWVSGPSMGSARSDFQMTTLLDQKILVTGGFNYTNSSTGCEIYDPVANTFSPVAPLCD